MSKQFVNDVVSIAILATCWHEVPMPPLEGNVVNLRIPFLSVKKGIQSNLQAGFGVLNDSVNIVSKAHFTRPRKIHLSLR